jgi:hypothetical protein
MGKHGDEYARVERDDYPTPAWVIGALAEHVKLRGWTIWEMACGKEGRMSEALKAAGCARVYSTDISNGYAGQDEVLDFLSGRLPQPTTLRRVDNQSAFRPARKDGRGIYYEKSAAAHQRLYRLCRAPTSTRF